jgi:hypothetical protein
MEYQEFFQATVLMLMEKNSNQEIGWLCKDAKERTDKVWEFMKREGITSESEVKVVFLPEHKDAVAGMFGEGKSGFFERGEATTL